jgi:hypothetical protein
MNKLISGLVIYTILFGSSYYGSTMAPVTIAGAIIKAQSVETTIKYKRKDCPVCKGKGWYISGDGIKKVDCGYCEPEKEVSPEAKEAQPICDKNGCKTQVIRR